MMVPNDFALFARRFLTARLNWHNVVRNGVTNFGNIISLVLYREGQYQVELFICPHRNSSFSTHRHPDIDTYEFQLAGDNVLTLNDEAVCTEAQVSEWMYNMDIKSPLMPITHNDYHSGQGTTPFAFLSIQHWLNNVQPTSAGLNWIGDPSSVEQAIMLDGEVT